MTLNAPPEPVIRSVWCSSPAAPGSGAGLHRMVYSEWGDRDNPRVLVCAHGLARNGQDFDDLGRALGDRYRIICPDVAGRGRSDRLHDPMSYGIPQYVADMMVLIARLDVESVGWLGTSMGGLIGMVLASLDHSPIARLLLNDVGPAIAPESIRRIGEYLGRAPTFASIEEAEQYIRLVSAPFGVLTDVQWRHLTESSVRQRTDGRLEMGYDPAIADSFQRATADGIVDLWPVYDRIRCPTLLVRGAKSDLLTHETAQAMSSRGPHPQVVEVPEVGHAPMFMAVDQIEIVERFFADLVCSGAPSMPSVVGID